MVVTASSVCVCLTIMVVTIIMRTNERHPLPHWQLAPPPNNRLATRRGSSSQWNGNYEREREEDLGSGKVWGKDSGPLQKHKNQHDCNK